MRALLVGLTLLAGAAAGEPAGVPPAAEGTALLEAFEAAPAVAAGTVEGRVALDETSWRARFAVETAVAGALAPGQRVTIAWEELARSRPPRFANGDRVLLALEPLPGGSLWRERFGGDLTALVAARGIPQQGTAFQRAPSLGSLSVLQHYLRLPPAERAGPAGQRHLLALAADGERALALSAAQRLGGLTVGETVGAEAAELVLRALGRADAEPQLADGLALWVERQQPLGLIPALDAALARPGGAAGPVVRARGVLGEGLAPALEEAMLASRQASQRAAAVAVAGPAQAGRLSDLLRSDPDPAVRAAAVRRLARLEGAASLDALLEAFADADAEVRNQAALHAAAFGPEAVPRMRASADWPWPAPQTLVLALRVGNTAESRAALVELADAHPDERVRTLAGIALGRGLGHRH